MPFERPILRALAAPCLAAFLPLATAGCFGGFHLTRNVYTFNKRVSNDRWVVWIVFLPLSFVYGGASIFDALVFNSIEFWSGKNPIILAGGRTFEGPNGERARVTHRADGVFDAVVTERSGATHHVTLVRSEEGVTAFDAAGSVLARATLSGGRPVLLEAPGL